MTQLTHQDSSLVPVKNSEKVFFDGVSGKFGALVAASVGEGSVMNHNKLCIQILGEDAITNTHGDEERIIETLRNFLEENNLGILRIIKVNGRYVMAAPIFETKENVNAPGLTSAYGCGNTVREVILDLAKQLSGRLVVINAGRDNRREIQFPQL